MIENFTFFILGVLMTLIISHYYYKRSSNELPRWFTIRKIKEIITKNPDDIDWTAKEIVNLYNNKIYSSGDEPLPYNYCPRCGSDKISKSTADDEAGDETYYVAHCKKCGWSDWTQ